MYTIFLARFVAEHSEFLGFHANFSTSKKVSAIHSCLRNIGVHPILIVTHVGDIPSRMAAVRKIGDCICIIPASNGLLRNRMLRYIHGIIFSSMVVYKIRKSRRVSLFFSWDYLPDTLIPILLQGTGVLSRTIVDVEESIAVDPRAGRLFKVFEYFVQRYFRLRTIGNNASTAKTMGIKFEGVFPGFFANSLAEEKILLRRVEQKVFGAETVVLFSGRIDTVRGASQFVDLARRFESDSSIRFLMTGYGSQDELAEIERIAPINLSFLPSLSRLEYLNVLFTADIAFNFISDTKFASNSFPSKIVEYLMGAVVVLSNHHVGISSERLVVCEELEVMESFISKYHINRQTWRAGYCSKSVMRELNAYSITSCTKHFRRLFNA